MCHSWCTGCGEQCQRKTLEIERLQLELHALLERFQEQRAALAEAQQQVRLIPPFRMLSSTLGDPTSGYDSLGHASIKCTMMESFHACF